jgi:CheY-like chemotaxis protein
MSEETGGKRVLVVEDDPDMLDSVVQVLEVSGYVVSSAIHGRDALDQLAAGPPPCLILLDLMMPVMTGWELYEQLGGDPALAKIPVIFMSAAGSPPEPGPSRRSAYLRKPIPLDVLVETIRQLCE